LPNEFVNRSSSQKKGFFGEERKRQRRRIPYERTEEGLGVNGKLLSRQAVGKEKKSEKKQERFI